MKMLHLRAKRSRMPVDGLFIDKLREIGEYDDIPFDPQMPEEELITLIGQYDVLLTIWGNFPIPPALAQRPGRLGYICNISGSLNEWVPQEIPGSSIQVTNWGDAPAHGVAEGAMALLLAVMKDIPTHVLNVRAGKWGARECAGGTLYGMRVGIYGLGVIGRRFVDMLSPFGTEMMVFDPYIAELPANCARAASLEELFSFADTIVVHAGRSPETIGSITAELLALLPDNGIVINTARGELFDQKALFAELASGRLRAGLDVLSISDGLVENDPIRQMPNCIFTAHHIGGGDWPVHSDRLPRMYEICLENLERYKNGTPLEFVMDPVRYARST